MVIQPPANRPPAQRAPISLRTVPSLFDHAGGVDGLHRLEETFYASVLADPLLQPLFGVGRPEHVPHLTAFTAESFGGPDDFSRELGFRHLIDVHHRRRVAPAARGAALDVGGRRLSSAGLAGHDGAGTTTTG